mgnify:CR=1 FL=1|tara:strand:+ start:8335 stop:8553 length:219 start_codon:yes stop_codon:yes gene_type:complete
MKIKMVKDTLGSSNKSGNQVRVYKADEILDCTDQWQKDLANVFLHDESAIEVKIDEPKETKKKKVVKKKTKK